jgi:hypothetical protein
VRSASVRAHAFKVIPLLKHRAGRPALTGQELSFLDPFSAALGAGGKDGTLRAGHDVAGVAEVGDLADALFNTVCWGVAGVSGSG